MPADTPLPGDSGAPLNLDARVPCGSCGGEFVWTFPKDDDPWFAPVSARCRCGNEWNDVPAPVTWRTLATAADEVPAAYVARLVAEVDRLSACGDELADRVTAAEGWMELAAMERDGVPRG